MTMIDSLMAEFEHEARTTRKHLEQLPGDKLAWRPREKSFTAVALASHITELVSWTDAIFNQDELDFDPATYKAYLATSVTDLIKTFDDNVANGKGISNDEQPTRFEHEYFERHRSRPGRNNLYRCHTHRDRFGVGKAGYFPSTGAGIPHYLDGRDRNYLPEHFHSSRRVSDRGSGSEPADVLRSDTWINRDCSKYSRGNSHDSARPGPHLVSNRADRACPSLYVVGWKVENQITND